jgi:fused signal recognition particle receptor
MTVIHPNSDALISPTRRADGIDARGSALFPAGGAGLYDRAAKARRSQKSTSVAMIAVPVAVVALGGAFYLSTMSGRPATSAHALAPVPAAQSVTRTTSQTTTAPVAAIQPRADTDATSSQARPVQQALRQAPAAPNRVRAQRAPAGDAASGLPDQPPAIPAAPSVAAPVPTPGTFQFTPAPPAVTAPPVTAPPVVAPAPVVDSVAPSAPDTTPPASPPGV